MDNKYDLKSAMVASKERKIHEWVLSFLRSSGNNLKLAKRLEKDGQFYLGPIDYSINTFKNIIGPDDKFKYHEDADILEKKVSSMVDSMQKGWCPPPLIVTNLWDDDFDIADGGHRQRAIVRFGLNKYPMIFYFKNQETMDDFLKNKVAKAINIEVAIFFGIKPLEYDIKIFGSWGELADDWLRGKKVIKAPSWLVAFVNFDKKIHILSPNIMPAGTNRNGCLRFNRTLKHELSHNYVRSLNKNIPSWLNEGTCLHVAEQNFYKPTDLNDITISVLDELCSAPVDERAYRIGKTMVDKIVNDFGRQKLLEVIAIQDKNDLYDELKQMFVWLK